VLLVNPRSGDGKAVRAALAQRARERGIEPVVLGPGDDLAALAAQALDGGADALGMAGGDGSLATVAAAATERDVPFICIPAGTRNHFALDLGIVRHDLVGALDAFTDGLERRIDLGQVNDRPFLNNVSLGIYGEAVRQAGYRGAKIRTMLQTVDEVLTATVVAPGILITDNRAHQHTSPMVVLASNNPYAVDHPLVVGSRPRLDTGRLGIIVVDRIGAGDSPVFAWSASSVPHRRHRPPTRRG
jgi:diacylglycerol kinase family enzyme